MKVYPPKNHHRVDKWSVFTVMMCVFALAMTGCQPAQPEPISGKDGIGDPYFPQLGNGGYDVEKYTLVLNVDPPSNSIKGKTTIDAEAIDGLTSFNLDFQGLTIDSITVNKTSASFTRNKEELTITPQQTLKAGSLFSAVVTYHGEPKYTDIITSNGAFNGTGWFHSSDGSINVMSEPNGASTWFPVNNHPRDKATYRFEITVPKPWVVAASGTLKETLAEGENTRYIWEMNRPMASYLASVNVDRYEVEKVQGSGGVIIRNYFPIQFPKEQRKRFNATPEMVDYYDRLFGPYPFGEYGVVVVDGQIPPCTSIVGGSLEAQSMSVFCPKDSSLEESIVAHELAHQWFGDSVSLKNWQDLWLKEGAATYAEWLWQTRKQGLKELNQLAESEKNSLYLATRIGQPPAADLYGWEQYVGGALTYHALRLKVGDEVFFKILRTYLEKYRYGNASAEDFIALSEEISGQELSAFFDSWLLATKLPEFPVRMK